MLKNVLKNVSKSVSKSQKAPESRGNGVSVAGRQIKRHSPSQNIYRRCAYGLANVMQRCRIRGRVANVARGARHFQISIKLTDPTKSDVFAKKTMSEAIAMATHSKAVLIRREYGYMLVEFELSPKFWEFYDRSYVSGLGIGLATRKKQVRIQFDDSKSQALIVGTTGSGKTVAIQSALIAMMTQYTPQDTKFVIIDPDKDHGDFDNEAHLMLPIAQSDNDIVRTITQAHGLFEHRHTNNIRDDYQLVILIDEITELIKRQPELYDIIASLANGRKFKINMIAAAHKVNKDSLPGKDKFTNRFIGKTDINDSFYATGMQGLEAHKLSGLGDFYHIAHTDVTRFQVAMPNGSDFSRLARMETPQMALDGLEVSTRLIDEATQGRPKARIEVPILADYLQYQNISVRKAKELGYGRTTHSLHKGFATDLISELNTRGLTFCNTEDCHE